VTRDRSRRSLLCLGQSSRWPGRADLTVVRYCSRQRPFLVNEGARPLLEDARDHIPNGGCQDLQDLRVFGVSRSNPGERWKAADAICNRTPIRQNIYPRSAVFMTVCLLSVVLEQPWTLTGQDGCGRTMKFTPLSVLDAVLSRLLRRFSCICQIIYGDLLQFCIDLL
jgi:hypothetical protein